MPLVNHPGDDKFGQQCAGSADAKPLPGIDEPFAIADSRNHGLPWEAAIPAPCRGAEDRSRHAFDPAIRGNTDRFVQLDRKPR